MQCVYQAAKALGNGAFGAVEMNSNLAPFICFIQILKKSQTKSPTFAGVLF
jgi:hypothetical protein